MYLKYINIKYIIKKNRKNNEIYKFKFNYI